jgi:hypothetical protein
MTYYFSKSTNGFYVDDVHEPHQIPNDAVEITNEQHTGLLEGQANGKQIASDANGNPILIDQIVGNITPLTPAEKLAKLGLTADDLRALLG